MPRASELSTARAVTRLLDCGLSLPRIAGLAGEVPVSTVRAWHAGLPPPAGPALRLAIAARVLDHFVERADAEAAAQPAPLTLTDLVARHCT
jgi:hypothetical protein